MAITRATNLAGLGTVFDALTDGGGLEITSGVSTISDVRATDLLFVGSGSTTGLKNQPLQVIGDTYISGSIGVGTTGSFGSLGVPTNKIRIVSDSLNNATSASPLYIQHPKNTIGLFIGNDPANSTSGYGVNDYSSTIRYDGSGVAWGDISYYPMDVGFGQFRFARSGSTVVTTPNASIGAGALYANSGVGIGTTLPALFTTGTPKLRVVGFNSTSNNLGPPAIINNTAPFYGGVNFNGGNLILETDPGYDALGLVSRLTLMSGEGAQVYLESHARSTDGGYADFVVATRNSSAPTEKLRVTYNGLVGIGITNPGAMSSSADDLVVSTSGDTGITILSGSTNKGNIYFANAVGSSYNNGAIEYDQNAKAMNFYSYGASYAYYAFHAGSTENIRFPYTGGITFNGDTAAANALDDYEEGTFTGTLNWHTDATNTSTTNASSNHTGYYRKVGSLVYFYIVVTTSSTANYVYKSITGLPFTVGSSGGIGQVRVRGGRLRYGASTVTDCLFYSSLSTTSAGLNAEQIGGAFSGWIEVVAASQNINVSGVYHVD